MSWPFPPPQKEVPAAPSTTRHFQGPVRIQDVTPGGGCLATVSGRCGGAQLARSKGGGQRTPPPLEPQRHRKAEESARCLLSHLPGPGCDVPTSSRRLSSGQPCSGAPRRTGTSDQCHGWLGASGARAPRSRRGRRTARTEPLEEDPRATRGAHGTLLLFLMQCVVDLKLRVEKLDVTMAPGGAGAGEGPSSRLPRSEPKEDREERILALLGIVGTILNLLVVIFVYIYTTI